MCIALPRAGNLLPASPHLVRGGSQWEKGLNAEGGAQRPELSTFGYTSEAQVPLTALLSPGLWWRLRKHRGTLLRTMFLSAKETICMECTD